MGLLMSVVNETGPGGTHDFAPNCLTLPFHPQINIQLVLFLTPDFQSQQRFKSPGKFGLRGEFLSAEWHNRFVKEQLQVQPGDTNFHLSDGADLTERDKKQPTTLCCYKMFVPQSFVDG